MLKFSFGNMKLTRGEVIFDLPAGHTCPFADKCFTQSHRITGKLTDGPNQEFRCYAASMENYMPNVRLKRWENFDAIRKAKTRGALVKLIKTYLPYSLVYRVHSSGDFFSQVYFDAWMDIARAYPERIFYAYTKAIPFWVKRLRTIPKNFKLTASYGGKSDNLIAAYNLKSVRVVESELEARKLRLPIDHDDALAWQQDRDFALLIHGNGPPGSVQAKLQAAKSIAARAKNKKESALCST